MATTAPVPTARRQLLERYRHVREDHLRYLQKLGMLRPERAPGGDIRYTFADLAVVRQLDVELEGGASFKLIARNMLASREGQLTFDFRLDVQPAKVLRLERPAPPPMAALMNVAAIDTSSAEECFSSASSLDDGDPARFEDAMDGYRRALEIDPYMVPALINLANIHYARNEIAEAQALYERAIILDADVFEAHFNLGNILHDLRRFGEAQVCYRQALRLNPSYADAHFYLAVTLEKSGHSPEARPHWRAYQRLAPNGEWVSLAQEFSE